MYYLSTPEIEIAVAHWLGVRKNLIVPKVSWGLNLHECDVLALSDSGYATEVEIKISRGDLRRDGKKWHKHNSQRIKYLWYAMPLRMENYIVDIPEHAGVVLVNRDGYCTVEREAVANVTARKFTDEERYKLARLGTLRIWDLKERLLNQHDIDFDFSI